MCEASYAFKFVEYLNKLISAEEEGGSVIFLRSGRS